MSALRFTILTAAVMISVVTALPADDLDSIRQMPAPERVSPEEFLSPDPFQPSADLGIVHIPSPHFNQRPEGMAVDTVIVHYMSGINVDADNPFDVDLNWNILDFYSVSSHYIIDREGQIYQLVRESDRAWHAGASIMPEPDNRQGVNDFGIGIEVLAIHGEPFEDAQYDSLIALVRDIRSRMEVPMENIVGHEDIGGERAVAMGLRRSPKIDPGPSFDWDRFRAGLSISPELDLDIPEPEFAEETISGTVYRDSNANGVRDEGEAGWPGVGVSNGAIIAVTDERGVYALPASDEAMELVFVIQPADCALTPDFYRAVRDISDFGAVDFGLVPSESDEDVVFAQVTDIHVAGPNDFDRFLDGLEEVDNHPTRIDFVMATGDLVSRGQVPDQLATYSAVVEHSGRPWMNCFGNHDRDDSDSRAVSYRHFLGPDWYSFDRGDCHFVVRNSINGPDAMDRWIDEDLRLFGAGKTLVIFQHYHPTRAEQFERFAALGARAIISGHWHSNRIIDWEGLMSISTPTFIMGGIDVSPSGYRIISVDDDQVTSRFMFGRTGRILTVQSPASDLTVYPPVTEIHAAVYDSEHDVTSVQCDISGGQGIAVERRHGALEQVSPLGWTAEIEPLITPGPYGISLTATDGLGDQWTVEERFELLPAPEGFLTPLPLTPWPMFMGSPNRLGLAAAEYQVPLAREWTATHPVTFEFGSPITDGQHVFVGLRDHNGTEHCGVAAHDPQTGEQIWFAPTESAVCHTVATDGERVYAMDHGGRVYALDVETGVQVWTHAIGDPMFRWGYSAPALVDDALICGTSGGVANLDPATGDVRWETRPGSDWISSWSSPSVADGIVVMSGVWQSFGDNRRHSVIALDLATGEQLWTAASQGCHASPVIFEGQVHIADIGGVLMALDLHTGQGVWRREMDWGWATATPAIDPGTRTLIAGGADGIIHALSLETQEEIWSVATEPSPFRMSSYQGDFRSVLGSPTIAGDLVFIGSADGRLRALDLGSGEERWGHDFGVPVLTAPCPSGGRLFVAAMDGSLVSLRSAP